MTFYMHPQAFTTVQLWSITYISSIKGISMLPDGQQATPPICWLRNEAKGVVIKQKEGELASKAKEGPRIWSAEVFAEQDQFAWAEEAHIIARKDERNPFSEAINLMKIQTDNLNMHLSSPFLLPACIISLGKISVLVHLCCESLEISAVPEKVNRV